MDNEKNEQSCNQSQHKEKPAYWIEGLNHKEEEGGSQLKFSSYISNSYILCQEVFCPLDFMEERMIFPLKCIKGMKL